MLKEFIESDKLLWNLEKRIFLLKSYNIFSRNLEK